MTAKSAGTTFPTPSQAPALESRGIRQRPIMWRAFSVNSAGGPVVMPGGLARVGKIAQAPQLWPAHAGFTKDIWISDETANFATRAEVKSPRAVKDRHPSALEVPSRSRVDRFEEEPQIPLAGTVEPRPFA